MLRVRALGDSDREAVLAAAAARDRADFGIDGITRELLADEWSRRDFDSRVDATGADDGRAVVGYAAVSPHGTLAFVDPAREGEGFGSELFAWSEARMLRDGRPCLRRLVASGNASGRRLLERAGYRLARSLRRMVRELGAPAIAVPPVPDGIVLAQVRADRDARQLHAADARMFSANADYEPESLTDFYDEHLAPKRLDADLSTVAWRGERIAGFALCRRLDQSIGWIDLLAVDPEERERGLATALLVGRFAAFAAAGLSEARLGVASDNPRALRLYDRCGMRIGHQFDVVARHVAGERRPAAG